jgi:PhnB protein
MTARIKRKPEGYPTATPYLIFEGAAEAIAFLKAAFGATEVVRFPRETGGIMHAEVRIGDSPIMLADEAPAMNARSPRFYGGSPVSLMLYVEDVDATFARAIEAGAKVVRPVADEPHGDRMGGVEDPFGYQWWIASRLEDAPTEP